MRDSVRLCIVLAAGILFLGGGEAVAQGPPGVDPERVREAIRKYMDSLPKEELKLEGITLVYKKVPGDPGKLIREVVDKQWREFVTIEMVKATLHSLLEEAGTLETKREITFKVKRKKVTIPPGKYAFGVYVMNGIPAFVGISGKGLEDPAKIHFRARKDLSKPETLKVEGAIKKKKKLQMGIAYGLYALKLPDLALGKIEEPKEEPKEEPGKEGSKEEEEEGGDEAPEPDRS